MLKYLNFPVIILILTCKCVFSTIDTIVVYKNKSNVGHEVYMNHWFFACCKTGTNHYLVNPGPDKRIDTGKGLGYDKFYTGPTTNYLSQPWVKPTVFGMKLEILIVK